MKERVWLTVDGALMQVGLGDVPAALEQELALPIPLLPESPRNADQFCTFDVVEHDDVRARVDRFVRFFLGADLDLQEKAESANLPRLFDGVRYRACTCIWSIRATIGVGGTSWSHVSCNAGREKES